MRKGSLFREQLLDSDREAVLESVICVGFVVSKSQVQITRLSETMRDRLKVQQYLKMLDFPLHFFSRLSFLSRLDFFLQAKLEHLLHVHS